VLSASASGYFYPNKVVRNFLLAMEDVMGHNGVSAVLNLAGLHDWVGNYPPDDLDRSVDFSAFSAINATLLIMYGPRGGRGLARRSAWVSIAGLLNDLDEFAALKDLAQTQPSVAAALDEGVPAIASALDAISDQKSTVETGRDHYTVVVERCPACWGQKATEPTCHAVTGWLEECLRWLTGGRTFEIIETHCIAMGDHACRFTIDRQPL
jgi:hypothetical protein